MSVSTARLKGLALFPILFAVGFVALAIALEGPARTQFVVGQKILVRALAIVGCVMAARVFQAGDRLRAAWVWFAFSTFVFLSRDLMRLTDYFGPQGPGATSSYFSISVLVGNAALIVGSYLLAKSWRVASAMGASDRRREIVVTLLAVVLALAVAGPAAFDAWNDLQKGDRAAMTNLASALGDIVSLALVAPIVLTAIHMRHGALVWPWALLAASRIAWLFYDAATLVGPTWTPGFPLHEVFRGLGETFLFSAGCAQAWVLENLRK
jgi:hypothetical protein